MLRAPFLHHPKRHIYAESFLNDLPHHHLELSPCKARGASQTGDENEQRVHGGRLECAAHHVHEERRKSDAGL
jgi:hypothetical protein